MFFRCATFVGVNMRVVAAKNRMIWAIQSLQAEDVGTGSVEGEEDIDIGTEVLLEFLDGGASVRVITVGDHMSLVRTGYRFENFGMNAGIIVAGEASGGLSKDLLHTGTMYQSGSTAAGGLALTFIWTRKIRNALLPAHPCSEIGDGPDLCPDPR